MDTPINIKVETEDQISIDNLNYGQDCRDHFCEISEVFHSSSNNVETESLDTHIKQEQPTVSIKEELSIVTEINYEIPQDKSVLNDFLWPSYLKKEPVDTEVGSEVGTEDGSLEKTQFNEIQKSKYPLVLLKDLKYTHEKILDQHQREEFRKRLRQKRPIRYCTFEDESLYPYKKLRSRLSQKSLSEDQTDAEDHETVSRGNNKSKDSYAWNIENNFREKNKSRNSCDQNKTSDITKCRLKSHSISDETGDNELLDSQHVKHKNTNLFKCDHCDFESDFKRDLVSHNLRCCSKKAKLNLSQNCEVVTQSKNSQKNTIPLSEIMLLIYKNRESLNGNAFLPSSTEVLKCLECNFETTNPKYLEFHLQIHAEVLKCPECSYESADTETFKGHLMTHLDQFPSESESVPYTFRTRSKQFNKTVLGESSDNQECQNSDFNDKMLDIEEEDILNNDKPCRLKKYKCHDCSYATYKNIDFVAHCSDHAKKELFKCEYCDFKTNYKCAIKSHNKRHNPEVIKNPENDLSKCFNIANDDNENYHMLSLSEIINLFYNKDKSLDLSTSDEIIIEVFKCVECTFETENLKLFNLHSQIHFEVKKCTECNFESKDVEAFKDHLINHFKHKKSPKEAQKVRDLKSNLKNTKFSCTDCSYETKYKESFDAHCAKHKNIKLFKCDDCDFESNYKKHLKSHKLKSCPKNDELNSSQNWSIVDESKNTQFGSLSLSEIMLLIYNNRKLLSENTSFPSSAEPLKCSECNFETESQKYLEFHSQIHSKVQKCPECSHESTDTETFKKHLITHLDHSTSVSKSVPYSLRKSSRPTNKTVSDELSEENEMSDSHSSLEASDFEDEMSDIEVGDTLENVKPRKRKKFECHDCSYATCDKENFISHCLNHAKEKLFQCEHCNFKTNYRRTMRRHNLKCLKNLEIGVIKCLNITNNEIENYLSLSLSEIINLICCKSKSLDLNTSDQIKIEVFKCLDCRFETGNLKFLNLHSQIHVDVKKCTECNFESKDTETFKNHLVSHLKSEYRDSHFNINKCKFSDCSYETHCKELFDAHQAIHKNNKLFKCNNCSFRSHYKRSLIRHNGNHCPNKPYLNSKQISENANLSKNTKFNSLPISEIVLLICNNRNPLDDNSSVLSPKVHLKCSECSFETENQKYFEFHSQIHAGVHKCLECGYESTDTESFKEHLITHLDESESVPFSSKKRSRYLSKTDVFNLACEKHSEISDSHNSQNSDFENEMSHSVAYSANVQMKKEYKCDLCNFKTNICSDLVSHLLLHHKEKTDCGNNIAQLENLNEYSLDDIISMIYNDENEVKQDTNLNSEKKLYKCSDCSFECDDKEQLLHHLSSHSSEKKFICSHCSYKCSNENELDSHLSKCSNESSDVASSNTPSFESNSDKVFKCSMCNFETKKEKHFTLHSQIHAELMKCTECEYEVRRRIRFKEHLTCHLRTKLYTCSECGYETNFIHKFKSHLLNHTSVRIFNCPECDYKTNEKSNFKYHLQNHLEFKTYKCSECDYSTSFPHALKVHILDHSEKKQFLCSVCNYGCNIKTRMERHLLQHSNEKLYKCSKCDFGTNHRKNLKDHEARRHGGQYLYACSHCDFKCCKPSSLKKHSLKHSDTKLYKCPECSYECNSNLKLHIQNMHSKTKMYKCSECSYEGNHRSNFLTHIRTHSNERKYSCSECSFSCKRKGNLKVHMTTHLEKKLFKCADCSYECSNKYQLRRHVLKH